MAAADAAERKVVFVMEVRDAATFARFADHLTARMARLEQIIAVSIDMSPAFIRGIADHLPRARIIVDEFHVVARASVAAVGLEQRAELHGCAGWTFFKDLQRLSAKARSHLAALISQAATKRTARACLYHEGLRAILESKQANMVAVMPKQWCWNALQGAHL